MRQCIYCNKTETETSFKAREHVIPKLLGTFQNNPTLIGWVCDNCNSIIFNPLETKFKEDTEEGIYYQMFNFENSCQIRISGKKIKTTFSSGLGDDFFNEWFPFLRWQDSDWKVFLLPQIKIKRYGDTGYLVLLVDGLKNLDRNGSEFLNIKKLLQGVESKNVRIFTGIKGPDDDSMLQEAITLVRELGIDYKSGTNKISPALGKDTEKQFEINMHCTVGNDIGRVIAKIAFNYFAYCAIQSRQEKILYHPNFSKIKSYVLGDLDLPVKEIITDLSSEPLLYHERDSDKRLLGHIVTFSQDSVSVIVRVSLLNLRTYTVVIGPAMQELQRSDFGCGHIFDPINHEILQLTQNPSKQGSGLQAGFGLFNRI